MLAVVVLLMLFAPSFSNFAAEAIKGPYLIFPDDNTKMWILWETDGAASCEVRWGNTLACADGVQTLEVPDMAEILRSERWTPRIEITGLTPGEHYYYEVVVDGHIYTGEFMAAPPDDATAVKLFVMADSQMSSTETREYQPSNIAEYESVLTEMWQLMSEDPALHSLILHAGDWTQSGREGDWEIFFDEGESGKIFSYLPVQGCIGNHDTGRGGMYDKLWPYPYVENYYWSFDYGPVHVSVIQLWEGILDYELAQLMTEDEMRRQLSWLDHDLRSTDKQWKVVLLHHPVLRPDECGGGHPVWELIAETLVRREVDVVISGHWHDYESQYSQSLVSITAPSATATGIISRRDLSPGFLVLDFNADRMACTFYRNTMTSTGFEVREYFEYPADGLPNEIPFDSDCP